MAETGCPCRSIREFFTQGRPITVHCILPAGHEGHHEAVREARQTAEEGDVRIEASITEHMYWP